MFCQGQVESVTLDFNQGQLTRTENVEPYALFGDRNEDFFGRPSLQVLQTGENTIDFGLYSEDRQGGDLLATDSRSFTVVDDLTGLSDFTVHVIDAGSDSLIAVLQDGDELQSSEISGKDVTLGIFVPEESQYFGRVESLFLNLNEEAFTRTENVEPYALFGDTNGNFQGQSSVFQSGTNSLEFDVYSQNRLQGDRLDTVKLSFTVVE